MFVQILNKWRSHEKVINFKTTSSQINEYLHHRMKVRSFTVKVVIFQNEIGLKTGKP